MRRSAITAPLRRPLFRRLATTYAINEMGDWMGIVALSVLVYEETGSALATTVLFLGTRFLPAFLAPLLVTRIERPPPRLALPLVYCGETAAFGALALLVPHFSLALVVALATIDGTLALAGRALTRAVVARVLEPAGELREGNAVLNVAFTAGAALGPGLAGLVVAGLGVQAALFLNAASFYLVAWILIAAGRLPRAEPEAGSTIAPGQGRRPLPARKQAPAPAAPRPGRCLRLLLRGDPGRGVYAKETLGTGDTGYGVMLASWGFGMLLGSLVFARGATRAADPAADPLDPGGGGRLPRIVDSPDPRRCLPRLSNRGYRERGSVGFRDQRGSRVDRGGYAGAGHGGFGVDRSGDARGRVRSRWLDSCDCDAADDVPGRRFGSAGDRRADRPDAWREGAAGVSRQRREFRLTKRTTLCWSCSQGGMPS